MARFDFQPERKFDFRPIERKFDFRPEPPTVTQVIEAPELTRVAKPTPIIAPEPPRMPPVAMTPTERPVIAPELPRPEFVTTPEDIRPPYTAPQPVETAIQKAGRMLKRFWNINVDTAHELALADEPALFKAKLHSSLREQEIKDIAWQLGLPPEARDDDDLRKIPEVYPIGEDVNPFPTFNIPPGQDAGDYIADTIAGIGSFVAQIAFLKKVLPGAPSQMIWEIRNIATGGKPGRGVAINTALQTISQIPTVSTVGKGAKVLAGGGLFGGLTYAEGGNFIDVSVSAAIGAGFQAWDIHKQNQWLKSFKSHLKKAEYVKAQKAIAKGNRFVEQRYRQALAVAGKNPDAIAKANYEYQRDLRSATRIGEDMLKRMEPKIDRAMDIIARRLHHGKLTGKEAELAKQIAEKGLTPEAVAEVAKVRLPKKPREELAKKGYRPTEERLFKLKPKRGKVQIKTDYYQEAVHPQTGERIILPPDVVSVKAPWRIERMPFKAPPTPEAITPEKPPTVAVEPPAVGPKLPVVEPTEVTEPIEPELQELLKSKPSINKFLPKSANRIITKEGEYTNGEWLIKKEFVPPKVKERIDAEPSGREVSSKDIYPEDEGSFSQGIVGIANLDYTPAYILRNAEGVEIGINKDFYDYLDKHIPNFRLTFKKEDAPAVIYSGRQKAGLIMPVVKNDIKYIKPSEEPPTIAAEPTVGKKYEGKAYRAETGLVIKGETAADVVRYKQEELGNDLGVSEGKIAELEKRPERDIVWVARDKETAARYGEPEEVTDAVSGGEIIAEIPDGVLVLKPPTPAKPPVKRPAEEARRKWREGMTIPELEEVLADLKKPYSKATKKEVKNFEQYVEQRKQQEAEPTEKLEAPKAEMIDIGSLEISEAEQRTGKPETKGPILVWEDVETGRRLIEDGYNRVFEALDRGEEQIEAKITYVKISKDGRTFTKVAKPAPPKPPVEKPGVGTVDNINVIGLADRFSERLKAVEAPIDNRQVKQWVAEELGVSESELRPEKGYSHKRVQEAMELALVRAARGIVEENRGQPDKTFRHLQQLYERQPILAARTGISIKRQAYSTPAPLAFIASELTHITPDTMIYEPTAGTGMLTIGAAPNMAVVNELDPTRAEILRSQGYFRVSQEDARVISPKIEKSFDAVIMNPPFGKHKTVLYGKFKLSHIEHIIAAENLKAMKDEGRAVMIIAAPKKMGRYSTPEWVFGNYIYSHYNVIGDFEVAGELYRRQGAAWPVRVIAIHGRRISEKYGPKKGIFRANTWQEAYNKMKEVLADEPKIIYPAAREKPAGPEALRGRIERRPAEELAPVREPAAEPIEPAVERPAVARRPGERITERRPAGRRPRGRVVRVPAGEREVRPEPSRLAKPVLPVRKAPPKEEAPAERAERPAVREAEREPEAKRVEKRKPVGVVGPSALGKLQIPYKPSSKAPAPNENIPTYLEPHVTAALENLKQNVGDIDEYVREQLQYESNERMWEHLSASQVDSIALALDKIDKHSAMVVGHQTGVGKGRVAAGIVRREIINGRKPIFFTSGKHLFTDFFRDLFDVGLTEDQIKPLMMNADVDIKDQQNRVIVKQHGNRAAADQAIRKAIKTKDYNLVLSTYHQVNTETRKQRAQLATLMPGNVLILDESHNAAGESQTGEYIKEILIPHSSGVLFSSATYAKTPKTMALYARTGLLDAFDGDTENMLAAVQAGSEPYQEVIAAALARANSYIRTELDFSGVKYETTIDARHLERDAGRADKVTSVLRDIIAFDNYFAKVIVDPVKKEAKAQAKRRRGPAMTVGHTNFAAVSHNAIKQMLLALKIDETIEQAKQALRAGQRPIIALENTMESFLERYREQHGLNVGDIIKDFDYREVLLNMLRNTLSYTVTHGWGDIEVIKVPLEELPLDAQDTFHRAENDIKEMELDLPGSPIDEIISRLEAEGHKVGEITGRENRLIKKGKNEYELAHRSAKERDKTSIV